MLLPLLLVLTSSSNSVAMGWESLFKVVRGSVFEVVVPKGPDTGLTYAARLPWESVPIRQRKDSVWSIGTAFAIGRDTVVTASHVLWNAQRRTAEEPRLRTLDGRVLRIGKMLKFSNQQDFAVFTVPGLAVASPLKPAPPPALGQIVNAVGNALGEGIVLRDGLLTSRTPEEVNGDWEWVRFSAAASPGNSGGPLLDARGRVIGVVLAKSEAENLNVALPWSEIVKFPSGKYRVRQGDPVSSYFYQGYSWREALDTILPLPSTWSAFRRDIDSAVLQRLRHQRLMLVNSEGEFPSRNHSLVTSRPVSTPIPLPLYRDDRDRWMINWLPNLQVDDLVGGGRWSSASWGNATFAHFRLPDSIPLTDLIADSRKLSERFLRGYRLEREMAGTRTRTTSLGTAEAESLHTDRWGRAWAWRSYRLPWDGSGLAVLMLPQPCGFSMILVPTSLPDFRNDDGLLLSDLSDMTVASWHGTMPQWTKFLANTAYLPSIFRNLTVDSANAAVSWDGNRLVLPPSYMSDRPPNLSVIPGYSAGTDRKGHLEIGSAEVSPFRNAAISVSLSRFAPPGDFEGEEAKTNWRQLDEGRVPYNGVLISSEGRPQASLTLPRGKYGTSKHRWLLQASLPPGSSESEYRKALMKTRDLLTTVDPDGDTP